MSSQNLPVPLSPESRLAWVGFTELGSPVTYDTEGVLRWYNRQAELWVPMFCAAEHARGAADTYFVISVSEGMQVVSAILCKGATYPPTSPRPVPIDLPLQAPLCETNTDKTGLEERLYRGSLFGQGMVEQNQQLKEAVIKLFVLASKSELDDRALELLEIVGSVQLATLGLKYANRLNRRRLVGRLTELVHHLEEQIDSEEEKNDVVQQSVQQNQTVKEHHNNKTNGKEKTSIESQDLFVHSPVASSTQLSTQDLTISRLVSKPGGNPFSKKHILDSSVKNPLGLGTNSVDKGNLEPTPGTSGVTASNTNTLKEKPFTNQGNKMEVKDSAPAMNFLAWLKNEKSNLEMKFPDLNPAQLTQMARKIFDSNSQKRKANDDVEGNKSKQSKLSAFAYCKNK